MKTQATYLPVFNGFYHTFFDPSDSFIERETDISEDEFKDYYSDLHEAGVPLEWFQDNLCDYIDYTSAYKAVAEYICEGVEKIDYTGIIQNITMEDLVSPRYYNFSNDSINCEIEYDDKLLMEYLSNNMENFTKYITERYTSRDGFSSSYTTDIEYWLDEDNHDDHGVGALLNFVLFNEDDEADLTLYYASDTDEAFMNDANIDTDKMIRDFKKTA